VLAAAALVALTGVGCSVREEVTLRDDGSGEARLSVELHPIMIDYLDDLMAAMTGVEAEYPVFDVEQLTASFAERDGVQLVSLDLPARGKLELRLRFDRIDAVFAREGAAEILTLERNGALRTLTVRLDREAVQRFLEFAPEESMTMAQYLLPPEDGSVSREQYRDELAWALEEYAARDVVERVLDRAQIEVRVSPEGRIVRQRGGRVEDGTVVFTVPVLEVLTLAGERSYSVVFEP
jgi:hypothetical protein